MMKNRKAFTMVEMIFVIVVIGILSAIAVPKFTTTAVLARDAKAGSQLSAVMSSLATERQKRILKGDFTKITALGSDTYAFSKFSADGDNNQNDVLDTYVSNCGTGDKGCWSRSGDSYTYKFADTGDAKYKLVKNKLKCDNDATDCARLLK
jgi:general secretion pathway protein G